MRRHRWCGHLRRRPMTLLAAALITAGCAAAPGASPAGEATIIPGPTAPIATSPVAAPSDPDPSPNVSVRKLGRDPTAMYGLLSREMLERGGIGQCLKMVETERGIGEEQLQAYLGAATGVERLIGESVWLGTLEGAARSLDSVEVIVPTEPSPRAWIIARIPEGSNDAPAGSLAAYGIRRLEPPAGASLPHGAEVWLFTGDLLASMTCS